MDSELEKKMLQKLKESLQKPKEDAFESDDIVESLKDEFEQKDYSSDDSLKPVSAEELEKDPMPIDEEVSEIKTQTEENNLKSKGPEDELKIGNDEIKKDAQEVKIPTLEEFNSSKKEASESSSQISENIVPEASANAAPKSDENNFQPEKTMPQASAKPLVQAMPKKKSKIGLIIFLFILFAALIIAAVLILQ